MKPENLKFLFIVLGAIFAVFVVVSGFLVNFYDKKIKENEKKKSSLEGSVTPPKVNDLTGYFKVLLGGASISYSMEYIKHNKELNPLKKAHGVDFPLRITFEETPLISGTFKSFDSKVVAILEKNEWKINPNNYFDRNYDNSSLEIIDEYNIPILQVEYINEQTILIKGVFYQDEDLIIVNDSSSIINNGKITFDMILKQGKTINRMFRYPSSTHFGEKILVDSDYIKSLRSTTKTKKRKNITDLELIEKSEVVYSWLLKHSKLKDFTHDEWQNILNEYYRNYREDAKYYKDELYKRTDYLKSNQSPRGLYDNPTNPIGMKITAEELRYLIDQLSKQI